MSWNGFPRTIRILLTSKLKNKPSNTCQTRNNISDENDARPKTWLRIPYLGHGRQGESLAKKCLKKLQRNLNVSVNFIVIYNTKNCRISCPIKAKFQNYESLKLYMKQLDLAVAKPTLAKQNDAYRNDFLNTTNQTKVRSGNTLTTASMCNISSVYIMHVMMI